MNVHKSALLGFAVLAGAAASARADDGCSIYRVNIPDLDQVRRASGNIAGLPNDGKMFCAPTSVCNVIGYLNNIGFPNLCQGPKNWQTHYAAGTAYITLTNFYCDVDPFGGGSMNPGFSEYVEAYYPDEFIVNSWNGADSGPTPSAMYNLMKYGCMMTFCYGRYEYYPAVGDFPARRVRDGGHCVTLSSVVNGCTDPTIGFRNPGGSGDSDTAQSAFATQYFPLRAWHTYWTGEPGDFPTKRKTLWIFDQDFEDGRLRAIDGMAILWPVDGLSIDAEEGILTAQKFIDLNMGLTNGSHPTHLLLPAVQRVREAAMRRHPHLPQAVVVLRGDTGGRDQPGLWRANLATSTWDRVGDVPASDAICFGPDGRLFCARGASVEGLDLETPNADPIGCPLPRDHTILAMATSDPGVDGDPTDYQLVMLTRNAAGGVFVASGDVDGDSCSPYDPRPLPSGLALPGAAEIAIDPTNGDLLLTRAGFSGITRCRRDTAGGWIIIENIATPGCQPKNPQVDNRGRVIFTCDGVVNILERSRAGNWVPKTDSRWSGYHAGSHFDLARGRSSLSHWANKRGDFNLDPDVEARQTGGARTVPDCPADFNGDGFIDFFDYDAYVECFQGEASACPANNPAGAAVDINQDGFVDFFDYDDFVLAFERGC